MTSIENEWKFNINDHLSKILYKIKLEKRISQNEMYNNIQDKKNTCIIKILNEDNYNKTTAKITSSCNIKCLNTIINHNNDIEENLDIDNDNIHYIYEYEEKHDSEEKLIDNDNITNDTINNKINDNDNTNNNYEVVKRFNILKFSDNTPTSNITIINILLKYDLIQNIIKTKNFLLPNSYLNNEIANTIVNNKNIIVFIDPAISEVVEEMAYVIVYMSYYLSGLDDVSIKFKCKDTYILKYSLDYVKEYFSKLSHDNDDDYDDKDTYSNEKFKEKKIKMNI